MTNQDLTNVARRFHRELRERIRQSQWARSMYPTRVSTSISSAGTGGGLPFQFSPPTETSPYDRLAERPCGALRVENLLSKRSQIPRTGRSLTGANLAEKCANVGD